MHAKFVVRNGTIAMTNDVQRNQGGNVNQNHSIYPILRPKPLLHQPACNFLSYNRPHGILVPLKFIAPNAI